MRVQFTVSQIEAQQLSAETIRGGFPNIPEYCKAAALKGKTTLHTLYTEMVNKIKALPPPYRFSFTRYY